MRTYTKPIFHKYFGVNDMSYEEALQLASTNEQFMATVYAMNTLLIHKGIYTHDEFQELFTEWVRKEEKKKARAAANKPVNARQHASV